TRAFWKRAVSAGMYARCCCRVTYQNEFGFHQLAVVGSWNAPLPSVDGVAASRNPPGTSTRWISFITPTVQRGSKWTQPGWQCGTWLRKSYARTTPTDDSANGHLRRRSNPVALT